MPPQASDRRTDMAESGSASSSPGVKFTTKFDLDDLKSSGLVDKLTQALLDDPQWLFGFFRRHWPVPKFRNWAMLTRYDDVREALDRQDVFEVPFRAKMEELDGDRQNFLLGMQDGPDYRRQRQCAMKAFKLEDMARDIAAESARISQEQVARANGRLDAIRELVTFVPTELCVSYFGLPIAEQDREAFAMWAIAMSAYTFNPLKNRGYHRAAIAGAERTRAIVDHAIATTKNLAVKPNTILGRLVTARGKGNNGLKDVEIRAVLMGMITGFVPTNTMAAGHMLEMLLRRPQFLAQASAAALASDDELLSHCLFEAMRFKPLNFGPFRRCSRDYTIATQSTRATTIRKGTNVLVSTQSAMFDSLRIERPYEFDPQRPSCDYMLFGSGLHWCLGAFVADAQITQMFKALLVKSNIRRAAGKAGRLTLVGPFPAHLTVEYDP
jgi:cytochrome P450